MKALRWIYAIILVVSVVVLGYLCAEADERDIANASLYASATDAALLNQAYGGLKDYSSSTDAAEIEEFDYVGAVIDFGRFWQTDYSKEEYLSWVAVAKKDDNVLLVSEKVISPAVYSEEPDSLRWSTSKIREYLNGYFANSAFSQDEYKKVQSWNWIFRSGGAIYDKSEGDKVFVLGERMVGKYLVGKDYFFAKPTVNAINENVLYSEKNTAYWVNNFDDDTKRMLYIDENGEESAATPNTKNIGYRPAIYISYDLFEQIYNSKYYWKIDEGKYPILDEYNASDEYELIDDAYITEIDMPEELDNKKYVFLYKDSFYANDSDYEEMNVYAVYEIKAKEESSSESEDNVKESSNETKSNKSAPVTNSASTNSYSATDYSDSSSSSSSSDYSDYTSTSQPEPPAPSVPSFPSTGGTGTSSGYSSSTQTVEVNGTEVYRRETENGEVKFEESAPGYTLPDGLFDE